MAMLELLLFLLSMLPIVHSENACPSSFCGEVLIDYPFTLKGQEQGNNCTYINLTCSNWGIPILSLPFSGNFNVRYINYYTRRIALYDPRNCLPRRFMNNAVNLSSSPFMGKYYENYTFYTCPVNSKPVQYSALPIGCLSNSTNATVATCEVAPQVFEYAGCKSIGSSVYPVMYHGQFELDEIYRDILLTWNVSYCKDCGQQPDPQETGSRWRELLQSPFFITSFLLLVLFFVSSCMRLIELTVERNETNETADHNSTASASLPQSTMLTIIAPRQGSVITGLDDSNIESCTVLVVVGENEGTSANSNSTCAICLEAYNPEEKVRRITKCGHSFHNGCIVPWLKKNSTCPVCRTSLSDVIRV